MDIAAERAYPTPLSNSTLLPLLLLSLAKQRHAPEPSKTIMSDYDYVIVGAGSAGSVVASRLSEMPCASVLLLEAGGPPPLISEVPGVGRFLRGTDIDWNYMTVPQKHTGNGLVNRQVVWSYGKAVGGSSVLNAMLNVRGNRKNYDKWAEEGAEGWSYKDVLPYFKKMEGNRDWEYAVNGYHGTHGPQTVQRPRYQAEIKEPIFKTIKAMGYKVVDPNAARQTGFYDFQATLRGGQRCSTAKAYLVPAENRTNLDILPHAMVRKVVIKNKRAVGVRFDFQGKTYTVNAKKEVIMSAGTVNTAQLLLLSGIGPKAELERFKITVHADLPVGKNLQDHILAYTNFQVKPHIPRGSEKLAMHHNVIQYIQNRTGPLTAVDFDSALAFLKNKAITPKRDFPDHQLYFAEAQADVLALLGLRPEVLEQVYGPYRRYGFMICVSQLLHPRSRGTVTLKSRNPYMAPAIDPNYLEDPKDVQDIVEGMKTCMRIGTNPIMKQSGIIPFDTLYPGCEKYAGNMDKYFTCVTRSVVSTLSNYVGTARMGNPKDPRTVVDPQLRVLKVKGLRVVDASVMPIIPSGNTNIPTIMVAEKASDIIKSTIDCNGKHEEDWSETDDPSSSDEPHNYPLDPDSDLDEKDKDQWTETQDSDKPHNYPLDPDSEDEPHNYPLDPDSEDEPHNYPLDPDSEDEPHNYPLDPDSEDEPHNYPLDPDSEDEPHNYPLDPDSDIHEDHEEQWDDKKEDSGWSEEPQHIPEHDDSQSVNHNSDVKSEKKILDVESPGDVWVVPWNKEIPNVIPWNQELLQSNVLNLALNTNLSNSGLPAITNNLPNAVAQAPLNTLQPQASLPGIANNPVLPNIQPQLPLNPQQPQTGIPAITNNPVSQIIQSQVPLNPQQPQTGMPSITNNPVLSNTLSQVPLNPQQPQAGLPSITNNPVFSNTQPQMPLNPPQLQTGLPGIANNPVLPNIQPQVPVNPVQTQVPLSPPQTQTSLNSMQPQLPNNPPEIKSYLEPEMSYNTGNGHLIHSHGHHKVIPWNKEIPNVVPWNQELLQSPLTTALDSNMNAIIANAGLPGITNNPVLSNTQAQLPLNPTQPQMPPNPLQPQIPGLPAQVPGLPAQIPGLPTQILGLPAQIPGLASQAQIPGMSSQAQIPDLPAQAQIPGLPAQIPGLPSQAQMPGMSSQAQIPGLPAQAQISGLPSQAQIPGLPSQTQMPGMPSQAQITDMPSQAQMPGMSSQAQIPGMPSQSQIPGMPSQAQMPGMPSQAQITGMPSQAQMPGMSSQAQMPGMPSQSQMPGMPSQAQIPGMPPQSQMPGLIPQLQTPMNPAQPQGNSPVNVNLVQMQLNKGAGSQLPGKVSQMRIKLPQLLQQLLNNTPLNASPINPAALRELERLRRNSPCDKDFCDALLNFMQCQDRSCQRRREFSSYMHRALCMN